MMFEDAARYLERVAPWDGSTWISINAKGVNKHGGSTLYGQGFRTIADAMKHLKWRRAHGKDKDIYMSMPSFGVASNDRYKSQFDVDRLRTNAVNLKSIFADLDVKPTQPEKGYADGFAATSALWEACEATGLPTPNVMVYSGTGGVHAYWTFNVFLSVADWQARADALSALLKSQKIKFDPQCTVDAVRVLRVPDTFNAKITPPSPVTLERCGADLSLDDIDAALGPYFGKQQHALPADVNDDLITARNARASLRSVEEVATVCPFIAHTLETGGAEDSNPVWHAALQVANYCDDGRNVAHLLSNQHPGYHPEETDAQVDRISRERTTRESIGWPSCKYIASTGAAECVACPLLALGKSPLAHAKVPVQPALLEGEYPKPYFKGKDNGYVYAQLDDHTELICAYSISEAWVSPSPWTLRFKYDSVGDGVHEIALPFGDASNEQQCAKSLAGQGFVVLDQKKTRIFMASFMQQLQAARESVSAADAFGWFLDKQTGMTDGFIYDGVRFTSQGNKRAARADENFTKIYTPTGEPQPWLDLVRTINNQKRPALDALIASAFAAPLVHFSGEKGFTMGGWSPESGIGKTTALMTAMAVWGSPDRGMSGLTDTENHVMGKIGRLKNLPVLWDEIRTAEEQAKFVKIIFAVTKGVERGRMNRSGGLARQGDWHTLLTYAANASMVDATFESNKTTQAGDVRLFEFKVPPQTSPAEDRYSIQKLTIDLKDNYGWAGRKYAEWLGQNTAKVRAQVPASMQSISMALNREDDERFWAAGVTLLLLGAQYANNLGLTSIDVYTLKAFLFAEFRRMHATKKDSPNDFANVASVVAVLAAFLAEKRAQNTLFTDVISGRGKPAKGSVNLIFEGNDANRLGEIQVQVATKSKIIRISDIALGEWLKRKQIAKSAVVDAMKRLMNAQYNTGGILGGGTRFAMTGFKQPLWEISVTGTTLEDHIDWDTAP